MDGKLKIHAAYIISILIAIIILLVTVDWASIPNLLDYLVFAMALASLLLAILAIVYAYTSGASIANTIGRLDTSANSVSAATSEVLDATRLLAAQMALMPREFGDLRSKLDSTHDAVLSLAKTPPAVGGGQPREASDDFARSFLAESPPLGLLILHVCALAHKAGIDLDYETLSNTLSYDDDYFIAFISAASAAGLLLAEFHEDDVKIKSINNIVATEAKVLYLERKHSLEYPAFEQWGRKLLQDAESFVSEAAAP